MGLTELLRGVSETLAQLSLPHFVTGAMAAIYFGEPRLTTGIDIVTAFPSDKVADLREAFPPPDFYVCEESAPLVVSRKGRFRVIHPSSGLKVNLIVAPETAFNRNRFARARSIPVESGFAPPFSSPEDVIVMKLVAFEEGGSEEHLRDIGGILRISAEQIDRDYIARWAGELGLAEIWERVQARVDQQP